MNTRNYKRTFKVDTLTLQTLITAILHEISYTADLKSKCAEIDCSTLTLDARLGDLQRLLHIFTEKEDDGV